MSTSTSPEIIMIKSSFLGDLSRTVQVKSNFLFQTNGQKKYYYRDFSNATIKVVNSKESQLDFKHISDFRKLLGGKDIIDLVYKKLLGLVTESEFDTALYKLSTNQKLGTTSVKDVVKTGAQNFFIKNQIVLNLFNLSTEDTDSIYSLVHVPEEVKKFYAHNSTTQLDFSNLIYDSDEFGHNISDCHFMCVGPMVEKLSLNKLEWNLSQMLSFSNFGHSMLTLDVAPYAEDNPFTYLNRHRGNNYVKLLNNISDILMNPDSTKRKKNEDGIKISALFKGFESFFLTMVGKLKNKYTGLDPHLYDHKYFMGLYVHDFIVELGNDVANYKSQNLFKHWYCNETFEDVSKAFNEVDIELVPGILIDMVYRVIANTVFSFGSSIDSNNIDQVQAQILKEIRKTNISKFADTAYKPSAFKKIMEILADHKKIKTPDYIADKLLTFVNGNKYVLMNFNNVTQDVYNLTVKKLSHSNFSVYPPQYENTIKKMTLFNKSIISLESSTVFYDSYILKFKTSTDEVFSVVNLTYSDVTMKYVTFDNDELYKIIADHKEVKLEDLNAILTNLQHNMEMFPRDTDPSSMLNRDKLFYAWMQNKLIKYDELRNLLVHAVQIDNNTVNLLADEMMEALYRTSNKREFNQSAMYNLCSMVGSIVDWFSFKDNSDNKDEASLVAGLKEYLHSEYPKEADKYSTNNKTHYATSPHTVQTTDFDTSRTRDYTNSFNLNERINRVSNLRDKELERDQQGAQGSWFDKLLSIAIDCKGSCMEALNEHNVNMD